MKSSILLIKLSSGREAHSYTRPPSEREAAHPPLSVQADGAALFLLGHCAGQRQPLYRDPRRGAPWGQQGGVSPVTETGRSFKSHLHWLLPFLSSFWVFLSICFYLVLNWFPHFIQVMGQFDLSVLLERVGGSRMVTQARELNAVRKSIQCHAILEE